MAGQSWARKVTWDVEGMCYTAPYLKLTRPLPILRGNSCKRSTGARKIYGKCADGQLPVFYRKIYSIINKAGTINRIID